MPEHPDYRVGIGHDLPLESTDVLIQQPMAGPVEPVERNYGISGKHHDQGAVVAFHFGHVDSPETYQALLGQFDLNDEEYANVTIYARNDRLYWRHYNGVAHRPEMGVDAKWSGFFLRDIYIYITDLIEIA